MDRQTYGFINIYYGTTSGNSRKLAHDFREEARAQGFLPILCNLGDFNYQQFLCNRLCVFFLSTYGQGGPTEDSSRFLEWLESLVILEKPLEHMNFVVFGLGNSNFEYFCGMAKKTRNLLLDLGAREVVETYESDAKVEEASKAYLKWKNSVLPDLISQLNLQPIPLSEEELKNLSKRFEIKRTTEERKEWEKENYDHLNLNFEMKKFLRAQKVQVVEIKEIRKSTEGRSTLYIRLKTDIPITSPACNIEIYPENVIEEGLFSGSVELSSEHSLPFPPMPVQTLMKLVNVSSKPTKSFTQEALYLCKVEEIAQKYQNLLDEPSLWEGSSITCEDIIKELDLGIQHQASLGINLPRVYTLAGWKEGEIELIVSLQIKGGRLGLTSKFLQSRPKEMRIHVLSSVFHLPESTTSPLVMIANGSGIAPFRSILKHYQTQPKESVPPLHLYYGCQRVEDDFYFREEWQDAERRGLVKLHIATSRQGNKEYVQKLFRGEIQQVKGFLFESYATFFICGSTAMEKEINNVLVAAFRDTGHKPYTSLTKVKELHKNKRIVKQVYG